MRKTSMYIDEETDARLRRLSGRRGVSAARVIREALAHYEAEVIPDRDFAMSGSFAADGRSVADTPEEELLEGFGS